MKFDATKLYTIGGKHFLVAAEQRFSEGRFITLARETATGKSKWRKYDGNTVSSVSSMRRGKGVAYTLLLRRQDERGEFLVADK